VRKIAIFAAMLLALTILASSGMASAGLSDIAVDTDASRYRQGTPVEVQFTNTGLDTVACTPWFEVKDVFGDVIYVSPLYEYLILIPPGKTFVREWDQTDMKGEQVPGGMYTVTGYASATELGSAVFVIFPDEKGPIKTTAQAKPDNAVIKCRNVGKEPLEGVPFIEIYDEDGVLVHARAFKMANYVVPPHSLIWQGEWDYLDTYGNPVGPGDYYVVVEFAGYRDADVMTVR